MNDLKYFLIIDGVETELIHSPSGWEDSLLSWSRNMEYHGMVRNFSQPMIFVLEGARLLRLKFYEDGLRSEAELRIERLNRRAWNYTTIFTGDIDFSTFDDRMHEVEVSIMDSSLNKIVKAYEKVKFEIPLNDPEAITVEVPGIGLVEQGIGINQSTTIGLDFTLGRYSLPDITEVTNDFVNNAITFQPVEFDGFISSADLTTSEKWFIQANDDTSVSVNGNISISTLAQENQANFNGNSIFAEIRNQDNELVHLIQEVIFIGADNYVLNYDFQYSMVSGEKLFLVFRFNMNNDGSLPQFIEVNNGELNISNSLVTPSTNVLAMRPYTLFERIMAKMNGGFTVNTRSFFLNSANWRRVVITCGDAIRGYDNPKIRTSFRDFFDSFNGIAGVGFAVENGTAVLEAKNYWFSNILSFDLGEIKGFNLSISDQYLYSSIKIGYPDKEYKQEWGREEVNSEQIYATPMDRAQKELTLVSPYRADQLGIEELRITPEPQNENQTDNKSDNDVFVIKIQANEVGGIYQVEGSENYESIQGFTSRNAYYNLDLTPKKNLLRHGRWLRSILYSFDNRSIRFESASKNSDVVTIDNNGVRVQESQWVNIGNLGNRLFIPYHVKFTTALPKNAFGLMNTFPRGYMRFSYRGNSYKGYIMDVSIDVARNSEREFTLLLHPDNNLLNLVH